MLSMASSIRAEAGRALNMSGGCFVTFYYNINYATVQKEEPQLLMCCKPMVSLLVSSPYMNVPRQDFCITSALCLVEMIGRTKELLIYVDICCLWLRWWEGQRSYWSILIYVVFYWDDGKDILPVVARGFAESFVAVNDRIIHDLCVRQQKARVRCKKIADQCQK